ncbi:MAG TPA: SPOR domain-containing protein [Terriglobales bacterium]|nr:SPOR domain-containing protein [Terriglobales bacterium]
MELTESLLTETEEAPEATFGTGRLLGIFFALVLVCALFFGFGYTLGRSTGTAQAATLEAAGVTVPPTTDATGAGKPSAANECTGSDCAGTAQQDLTFYKAVEQKDAQPALTKPVAEKPQPTVEPTKSATVTTPKMPAGFVVQVAALTKQDDADAMVKALRRKNYPVFVMNAPGDRYYRVQVGPYPTRSDASVMQDRLRHDGYKAIVKK